MWWSRPAWARGLKPQVLVIDTPSIAVAPRMGAWIETSIKALTILKPTMSRPAWARGLKQLGQAVKKAHESSRPAWARGLKPVMAKKYSKSRGRAPHGRVD